LGNNLPGSGRCHGDWYLEGKDETMFRKCWEYEEAKREPKRIGQRVKRISGPSAYPGNFTHGGAAGWGKGRVKILWWSREIEEGGEGTCT